MYLFIIILIIIAISMKQDITILCILGLGIIGFIITLNPIKSLIVIYKGITVSGKEFIDTIIIISLINAMSKSLSDIGVDEIMIAPITKLIKSKTLAFFILGITMTITSWFLWPTPAVVFMGSIMVPAAIRAGLPRIWIASVLCLFGKGAALSSDFVIQGSPSITAKTAGVEDTLTIVKASLPFWGTMCFSAIVTAFILMKKYRKEIMDNSYKEIAETRNTVFNSKAKIVSKLVIILFITDILGMFLFKLKGDDATSLIGGTAILILLIASLAKNTFLEALSYMANLVKEGFVFGIKVFAPIILIGAFFFLGSEATAKEILGENATGILTDIVLYVSNKIPISKFAVVTIQGIISTMLGISGSGFGGLPLVGTLANTFGNSAHLSVEKLAAFGQIITIWIGGGTVIPWSVAPVAAICQVDSFEIARRNLIPVAVGVFATFILGFLII
ncbi:hypothetical protein [Clostridium homopropionicum]|nr:hypothetical protein [Clostridium homopropionicum]